MNITLAPYYNTIIKDAIASGKYQYDYEVVQAGLELMAKEKLQNERLLQALKDGENSGEAVPFNNEEFKKQMKHKYIH